MMKVPKDLGMILLAAWLILFGLLTAPSLKVSFAHSGDLLALLAIAAGILLLMRSSRFPRALGNIAKGAPSS
jgi:hypothetical protein